MAKRLTDTEKYKDSWFLDLEPIEKLLFYYLIDNVDNAGFYEVSFRHIQFHLGISKDEILGAIQGLSRGLIGANLKLKNGDKVYLKKFLYHQKISPLNPFNAFHKHALKVFEENFNFVETSPFLASLEVKGAKTRDGETLKEINTTLLKYLKEEKGLTSPIVEVIVKGIVEVKEEVDVNFEKSEKLLEKDGIELYPTFDDFWNDYDKKTGSIKKLKPKWEKLNHATKEKIMAYIPDYKKSQPDKKFRKNPETFLNNESWNDEIIFNNEQNSNTSGSGSGESIDAYKARLAKTLSNT